MPSVWIEKGRGIVLHNPVCSVLNCAPCRGVVLQQPVCSVLNCAISLGREGAGMCSVLASLYRCYNNNNEIQHRKLSFPIIKYCIYLRIHTAKPRAVQTAVKNPCYVLLQATARKEENRNCSKILQFADGSPVFWCSLMELIWRRGRKSEILLRSNFLTYARLPVENSLKQI